MQISSVKRSTVQARQAYDRMSRYYDWLAGSSETPMMLHGIAMLELQPGESVLEIGCGTGKSLVVISRLVGSSGFVNAIDLSAGMLEQAKHRLEKADADPRISLVEGDGLTLPYRTGSFTAVFLSFTLELFDTPELPRVLNECKRVLLPGGRIGIVSLYRPQRLSQVVRLYEWIHAHLPAYVDCRPIRASELLKQAGFNIHILGLTSMWGLPVELAIAAKA